MSDVAVKEQDNSGLYCQLQQRVLKYGPPGDFAAEHLLVERTPIPLCML